MKVTIKSAEEIEKMRRAGEILAAVHQNLAREIKPGMSTLDIDRLGFTVKDTQAKATAEVKANSVDARATTGSAVDAVLGDSVIVKYGDYTYTDRIDYTDAHAGLEVCSIEGTKNNADGQ